MLELAGDPGLLDEPADHFGPVSMPFLQQLDRKVAAQNGVEAPEDDADSATGDLAQELQSPAGVDWLGRLVPEERTDPSLDNGLATPNPLEQTRTAPRRRRISPLLPE
jgi:hypothetical protein